MLPLILGNSHLLVDFPMKPLSGILGALKGIVPLKWIQYGVYGEIPEAIFYLPKGD